MQDAEPDDREELRSLLLPREGDLRALSFWCHATGILLLVLFALIAAVGTGTPKRAVVALVAGFLTLALGQGLWRYHAWARWLSVLTVGLGLSAQGIRAYQLYLGSSPIGTSLFKIFCALAVLWLLLHPDTGRVCNSAYRDLVRATPGVRVAWWKSSFFTSTLWILGLVILALIVIAIRSR